MASPPGLDPAPSPRAADAQRAADVLNEAIAEPLVGASVAATPVELFSKSFNAAYDASAGRLAAMLSPSRTATASKR